MIAEHRHRVQKRLQKPPLPRKKWLALAIFVLVVGALGTYLLVSGRAATYVVAVEAEAGQRAGGASLVSDSGASGGGSVRFNSSQTSRTIRLMPLGDSITLGSSGGYRTLLWKKMVQQDGKKVDFVGSLTDGPSDLGDRNHEGHSGWRIDQIRSQIDGWSSTYKPELVLLHIGTNDINQNYNLSGAPGRLQDLVNRLCTNNTGVELIVASIIPINGKSSQVSSYNSAIPGIVNNAKNAGCKATFFNMNQYLTLSDIPDGVHPSVSGYNKMAEAWYPVASQAYSRLQGL